MSRIAIWFSRVSMIVVVAALVVASSGVQPAYALSPSDNSTPPAPSGERLERTWARVQRIYEQLGLFFDKADDRIARAQALIDRAKANGKDVTELQAALDAFSAAVKQARPIYESGKGIMASHQGFDDSGAVADMVKALETVRDMASKLREIRQIVRPTLRGLREAVREFRQSNWPVPTATPGGV